MPPGASLLMRGLGMRATDRHIKTQKRGRGDIDKYNRPVASGSRYPDGRQGSLGGLSDDRRQCSFEYERAQLQRQGYISPHRNVRPRSTRNKLEFQDWLRRSHFGQRGFHDIGSHNHRPPNSSTLHFPPGTHRPSNHAHGIPGNPVRRPPRTQTRNSFTRRPHFLDDDEEDDDELVLDEDEDDDLTSLRPTGSFIRRRPSPRVVFPDAAPYYGGPLPHDDDDEDEDDDEFLPRRGGHMGRRRASHGAGREGGGFRRRSGFRGHERGGGLDLGFSGDEEDGYAY